MSGQEQVGSSVVIAFAVGDRTQQCHAIESLRQLRQMLGDEHAIDSASPAGQIAPNVGRCFRLAVEAIEVR